MSAKRMPANERAVRQALERQRSFLDSGRTYQNNDLIDAQARYSYSMSEQALTIFIAKVVKAQRAATTGIR
jgi:cell division protein FtsB